MPKVHAFTGICTVIYLPIRFTANIAQIPCKAVNKSAVKNHNKVYGKKNAKQNFTRIHFKPPKKSIGHIIFIILMLKLYLVTYNKLVKYME